jgi:hypothetical protein
MRMLVGALGVAAFLSPAMAENWLEIDSAPQVMTLIDKDLAGRSGTHVRFWIRQIFVNERRIGNFGGKPMTAANVQGVAYFNEIRSLIDIDCRAHTFATRDVKFYNREGRLVSEGKSFAEPAAFTPDMMIAAGAGMFCQKAASA